MPSDVTSYTDKGNRIAVFLCGDLMNMGGGLELEELSSSLESNFPDIAVEVIPNLCQHPSQFPPVAVRQGATRAVLGLCSTDYSEIELQVRARKANLDPFGLEVVPLGTLCAKVHLKPQATQKAQALLSAAIARARAFQGTRPEQTKPYFLPRSQKVTRRSLFTIPPVGYRPVPGIREERCVAETGCQLCARACPQDALRKVGGHLSLDKTRCEGCGVCLAACPREAVNFPGWSIPQFEAQLSFLLDSAAAGQESVGLLLTCEKALGRLEEMANGGVSYSHQWLPVVVPCLGMVTPAWVLQLLAHGAGMVALLFCGAGCAFGQQQIIGGRVNFCRRLLSLLGKSPERVRILSGAQPETLLRTLQEPPLPSGSNHQNQSMKRLSLSNLDGAFQAMQSLVDVSRPSSAVILEHPSSPFGLLELQPEGCTGCLTCVDTCPTGALASEISADEVSVTYLASACTGCGMCADVCPETEVQVLRVHKVTNLDALSKGKIVLHKNQLAICQSCGAAIASQTLLRHIETSLGGGEILNTALSRYCPSCRLSFAWGTAPTPVQHEEVRSE